MSKGCVVLQGLLDLAGIYRTWNPQYKSWSVFGQDHVARILLNYPISDTHDAVGDAIKSVRLFSLSQQLQQDPAAWEQAKVRLQAVHLYLCGTVRHDELCMHVLSAQGSVIMCNHVRSAAMLDV